MFKVKDLFIALPSESCDPDDPYALTFLPPNPTTPCCETFAQNWSMGPGTPWPGQGGWANVFAVPAGGFGAYVIFPAMPVPLKQYLQIALEQAAKPAEANRKATKPQTLSLIHI